jgi:acid stress-induced BolA-like protein IbaG/YrbA
MVTPEQIEAWIKEGLPGCEASVSGDGRHFEAIVVSALFEQKNTLARHRMVYDALGDKMDETIHALSMKTLTPEERG